MRVLLLKDVYKLGRAGDVKKVADGYGRNYLIPQGMAVLATQGALSQVEHIKARATVQRSILNKEMDAVAQRLTGAVLNYTMKASETGKLYGSVTNQMIADGLKEKLGVEITRRQIDVQPIRTLGEFKVNVRLTVDLIPSVKVFVYREGEAVTTQSEPAPEKASDLLAQASAPVVEKAAEPAPAPAKVSDEARPKRKRAKASDLLAQASDEARPERSGDQVPAPEEAAEPAVEAGSEPEA